MVLEKLLIAELQKIDGTVERKIVSCGITKLLCESQDLYTGNYQKYWPQLLQVSLASVDFLNHWCYFQALLSFFEMPVDDNTLPDDHFIEVDDTPTYQTASARLNFANNVKNDPLQGKYLIISQLKKA